jgi:hypothetical protein
MISCLQGGFERNPQSSRQPQRSLLHSCLSLFFHTPGDAKKFAKEANVCHTMYLTLVPIGNLTTTAKRNNVALRTSLYGTVKSGSRINSPITASSRVMGSRRPLTESYSPIRNS